MDSLNARGHTVRAFNTAQYGEGIAPKFQPLMDDLVKHYECWNKWDRIFFFPRQYKIEKKLRQSYNLEDFDLIHAHLMLSSGYTALRMKRKYGTKYVVSVRATDLSGFIKIPVFKSLAKKILTEASGIVFLSHVHKKQLFSLLGNSFSSSISNKCEVIGNCIEQFWEENVYVPRNLDVRHKEIKVITVAKIKPVKNICTAAEAVMELRKRGYDASLTVIGENQNNEEYRKICAYPCVNITPFMAKEELIKAYRLHDIFLLPSMAETFGRVYVEAMTQGLPVLYTKDQGFDGNYADGVVGYAVNSKDPNMIADCLEKTIINYHELSSNCIERCSDFYESRIVDMLEGFYEESMTR